MRTETNENKTDRAKRLRDRLSVAVVLFVALSAFRFGYRDGPAHGVVNDRTAASSYRDGPPPGHTGGFGEPTCQSCHEFNPLNEPSGTLSLDGLPDRAKADSVYSLVVTLTRPRLVVGGFQMGARFTDGSQAGSFKSATSHTTVMLGARRIQYSEHTRLGTTSNVPDTLRWKQYWRAPNMIGSTVAYFHVAANASNDDNSEFGDYIYTLVDSVLVGASD